MAKPRGPFVLLISGPGGAGKSTTAEAWARWCSHPAAHLSLDDVRNFVKSGYVNPPAGWNEDVKKQHALARRLCALMAAEYVRAGFYCVIDDVVFPDSALVIESGDAKAVEAFSEWETATYPRWEEDLGEIPHELVVLLPNLERCQERNEPREGQHRLTPRFVAWMHRTMVPWRSQSDIPVIDNSDLTIEQTLEELSRVLGPS